MNKIFSNLKTDIKREHLQIVNDLLEPLRGEEINDILDAGSGKTSLTLITNYFKDKVIDAIVYPGDNRKMDSIKKSVPTTNYNLIEHDLCKEAINKKYDLVVAHLLLGEAIKFGNTFDNLFDRLLSIDTKYIIIIDYAEDPDVNFDYIESYINNMKVIKKTSVNLEKENIFTSFIGKSYKGYLIQK